MRLIQREYSQVNTVSDIQATSKTLSCEDTSISMTSSIEAKTTNLLANEVLHYTFRPTKQLVIK